MRFVILIISSLVSISLHSQYTFTTSVENGLSLGNRTDALATYIGYSLFAEPNKGSLDYLYDNDFELADMKPNLLSQSNIPDPKSYRTNSRFLELNFGFTYTDFDFVLPGFSFLWGNTITYANNTVLEYEAGLAFPTIITGKIGIGKAFENSTLIVGVRPYPTNIYVQSSFAHRDKGYWTVSLEINPLNSYRFISFNSRALLTFGYRWHTPRRYG